MQKYNNTVKLLRYKNHLSYVSHIIAVFKVFRCPNCDTSFSRAFNLERHLTTCSERVKNVYPRNVYQIRDTLFDKLFFFSIKYTSEQILIRNLPISTLNLFVSKRKPSETQTQQLGKGNMSRYLYQFLQTLWKSQYSSATLILITSLHLLLELFKI